MINQLQLIRKHSLLSQKALSSLYWLLEQSEGVKGLNAEVGVYKGGTSLLIAANSWRELHAFDTFEGLPQPAVGEGTVHVAGEFKGSLEQVTKLLAPYPHAHVHQGLFPQTCPAELLDKQFAFVYLDVDLYQSTLDCLNFFYPRLAPYGVLVSDDYNWKNTPGVLRAFDEFLAGQSVKPHVILGTTLAYIQKPSYQEPLMAQSNIPVDQQPGNQSGPFNRMSQDWQTSLEQITLSVTTFLNELTKTVQVARAVWFHEAAPGGVPPTAKHPYGICGCGTIRDQKGCPNGH